MKPFVLNEVKASLL